MEKRMYYYAMGIFAAAALFSFNLFLAPNGFLGQYIDMFFHGLSADDSHTASIVKVEKVVDASVYPGDIGAKVNQANDACGAVGCEISVPESGAITTPIVLSDNRILDFRGSRYEVSASITTGSLNEVKNGILARTPSFYGDSNADMIKILGKRSVVIHDLAIDGSTKEIGYNLIGGFQMPKGQQNEIAVKDSSNVNITKVKVTDIQNHGIVLVGASNVIIRDSEFGSDGWNKYQLIWMDTRPNKNISILKNYIHDSSHAGVFVGMTDGFIIQGNTIDHNRVNTFYTGNGGQINVQPDGINGIIQNNKISNAGYSYFDGKRYVGHAIEMHGHNVKILNNEISGNAGLGVQVKDNASDGLPPADGITIEGNTFYDNGKQLKNASNINVEDGVNISTIVIQDNVGAGQITSFSLIELGN